MAREGDRAFAQRFEVRRQPEAAGGGREPLREAQLVDDDHEDVRRAASRAPPGVRAGVPAGAALHGLPGGVVVGRRRRASARPAPASAPPAISPLFRNVRRSTLLCSLGSMLSMRALILGPAAVLGLGLALALAPAPAAAAAVAPTCGPSSLDNSALQDGAVTVSPLPGSRDASPQTQISFLGVPAARAQRASASIGSRTGAHSGRLLAYSQGDGASFVPARPFAEGEQVTVRARLRRRAARRRR